MARRRGRGVVYVDEGCYVPDGYYAERPRWQQVANAAAGTSWVMGQAPGRPAGQGVPPSLLISDVSTGVLTALIAMCGLRGRARFGGSCHGHASLTAYNMATLDPEVRLYQREVARKIPDKHRFPAGSSGAHVAPLYYSILDAWGKHGGPIRGEKHYAYSSDLVFGEDSRVPAPVVRCADQESSPD